MKQSLKERFEKQFMAEPNSGCWLWTGTLKENGYGEIKDSERRPMKAHRASWVIFHGTIPHGLLVCHHCDTPACVNPNHLFLGTHKDNAADMVKKGRRGKRGGNGLRWVGAQGEKNTGAKLEESQVKEILLLNKTMPQREIGNRFGVCRKTVNRIITGKKWIHIHRDTTSRLPGLDLSLDLGLQKSGSHKEQTKTP
jgi:hypothetical protein